MMIPESEVRRACRELETRYEVLRSHVAETLVNHNWDARAMYLDDMRDVVLSLIVLNWVLGEFPKHFKLNPGLE